MYFKILLNVMLLLFVFVYTAHASDSDRANALFAIVKCPTCEGQSIKESDTPAAKNIKLYIKDQIAAGASDEQILDAISESYGEAVISAPKLALNTFMLWVLPLCVILYIVTKSRRYFFISRK